MYCLVWVYIHKLTQTLECCSIVSAISKKKAYEWYDHNFRHWNIFIKHCPHWSKSVSQFFDWPKCIPKLHEQLEQLQTNKEKHVIIIIQSLGNWPTWFIVDICKIRVILANIRGSFKNIQHINVGLSHNITWDNNINQFRT